MLKSVDTVKEATQIIQDVQELCESGGFNLTKFVCKTPAVLDVVPVEKRSDISIKEISKTDPGMVERALGVNWCIESDKFGFRITTGYPSNKKRYFIIN